MAGSKGVTPIVAMVLMLMIVIGLAGGFMAWMNTMRTGLENKSEEYITHEIGKIMTDFRIVSVSGNKIWIRNSGTQPLDTTKLGIFVDNQRVGFTDAGTVGAGKTGELVMDILGLPQNSQIKIASTSKSKIKTSPSRLTVKGVTFSKTTACPWRFKTKNGTDLITPEVKYTITGKDVELVSGGCENPSAPKKAIYGSLRRRINRDDGYDSGEIMMYKASVDGNWRHIYWEKMSKTKSGIMYEGYVSNYPNLETTVKYITFPDVEGIKVELEVKNTGGNSHSIKLEGWGDLTDGCGNCDSNNVYCGGDGQGSTGWCTESWAAHNHTCDGTIGLVVPSGTGSVSISGCQGFNARSNSMNLNPDESFNFEIYDFILQNKTPNFWTPVRDRWSKVS